MEKKDENSLSLYKIIEGESVTKEHIQKALLLDRKYYNISDSEQFDIEKCISWYNHNNQIYTMIKDSKNGDIVGYINTAPISLKCYEEIKAGKYPDAEINDTEIISYEVSLSPKTYILYFASIVIDNEKDKFIIE